MFGWRFWGVAALSSLGSALVIGLPTVLVPNSFWTRMTPTSPLDYAIWIASFVLIGPLFAMMLLYPLSTMASGTQPAPAGLGRVFTGTLLSFFSVGCPICNKLVVLLLGLSGAMTFFNPLRPFIGAASIVLLGVTLYLRVRVLRQGCPVPPTLSTKPA